MIGEPFRTFFETEELIPQLEAIGFALFEDLAPADLNRRYFANRADDLRVGEMGHIMIARNPCAAPPYCPTPNAGDEHDQQ